MNEPSAGQPPPEQEQPYPGRTADMEPPPRDEMRDYRGRGLLAGVRALVTGGDSGIGRGILTPGSATDPRSAAIGLVSVRASTTIVSSMIRVSFPTGTDTTTTATPSQNSHHSCTIMATPPTTKPAMMIDTRIQDDGLPCRCRWPPTERSMVCSAAVAACFPAPVAECVMRSPLPSSQEFNPSASWQDACETRHASSRRSRGASAGGRRLWRGLCSLRLRVPRDLSQSMISASRSWPAVRRLLPHRSRGTSLLLFFLYRSAINSISLFVSLSGGFSLGSSIFRRRFSSFSAFTVAAFRVATFRRSYFACLLASRLLKTPGTQPFPSLTVPTPSIFTVRESRLLARCQKEVVTWENGC